MKRPPERLFAWPLLVLLALAQGDRAQEDAPSNQDYLVRTWGADEGLPLTTVSDVAQTPEGYLWVGTLLNGLQRFDGVRFVGFGSMNVPDFRSMGIRHLMVDNSGLLWISTFGNALLTWDSSGFHLACTHDEMNRPDHLLWSGPGRVIFVNADGKLLCGQMRQGAWNWDLIKPLGSSSRTQYVADTTGRVWYRRSQAELGTWKAGVTEVCPLAGMEGQSIKTLAVDGQGHIWVGTDAALARWQGDHFETMNPTNGEAMLNVKRIIPAGNQGSLWVEANGRMRRCLGRQWVAESEGWNRDLASVAGLRFVRSDPAGGLWAVASPGSNLGLIQVQADGRFIRLTRRDGLPSNAIQRACRDCGGKYLGGLRPGGAGASASPFVPGDWWVSGTKGCAGDQCVRGCAGCALDWGLRGGRGALLERAMHELCSGKGLSPHQHRGCG